MAKKVLMFLQALVVTLFSSWCQIAMASIESIGPNGIRSAGLMLPNQIPLQGRGVRVGQVEARRPGLPGFDGPLFSNTHVVPLSVNLMDGNPANEDMDIGGGHALQVAGVIISDDGTMDDDSNGDIPLGVAISAELRSSAYQTLGAAGNADQLMTAQFIASRSNMRAINHSWGVPLNSGATTNGNSLLTLGIDWLATEFQVLQIVSGNQSGPVTPLPSDNYNGITVASSQKDEGVFRRLVENALFAQDAVGIRTSTDIVAPGFGYDLAERNNLEITADGTSFAAPHVTGTVALLQEFGEFRSGAGQGTWTNSPFERPEVMKAVLLNSADKIKDVGDGKYLGSDRTVLKADGTSTWMDSPAFTDQTIPLDIDLGAGHLNAERALEQFDGGFFMANNNAPRPKIGWDLGRTREDGQINKYIMGQLDEGVRFSATLAWDRVVDCNCSNFGSSDLYDAGDQFFEQGLTNLDLYLLPKDSDGIEDAVWSSVSDVSSVEHIFYEIETAGEYEFWVYQDGNVVVPIGESPFSYMHRYGLAWWTTESLTLQGDFDNDGDVDAADLSQWEGDFGINNESDADNDGDSDGADFLAWQRNFTGPGTLATAVPEPGSFLLFVLGLPMLLTRRARLSDSCLQPSAN